MRRVRRRAGLILTAALLVFPAVVAAPAGAQQGTGNVYTMSNSPVDNEILVFDRAADGSLSFADSYSTGGQGTSSGRRRLRLERWEWRKCDWVPASAGRITRAGSRLYPASSR